MGTKAPERWNINSDWLKSIPRSPFAVFSLCTFIWKSAVSFVAPPTETVVISMARADGQIFIWIEIILTEYSFNVS